MKLKPIYALIGTDEAAKHIRINALKSAFTEIYGSLSTEVYDASSLTPKELYSTMLLPYIFTENRIVFIQNIEKWSVGTSAGSNTDQIILKIAQQYITNPPDDFILVLTGESFPKKTKSWKMLTEAISLRGKFLEYNLPREWDMPQWISDLAITEEINLIINRSVAEYIFNTMGSDSIAIYNELVKLSFYIHSLQRNIVTIADVDLLITPRQHLSSHNPVLQISLKNFNNASVMLSQLSDTMPQFIHSMAREIRLMATVCSLVEKKKPDAEIKKQLAKMGFFRKEPGDWIYKQTKSRSQKWNNERVARSIQSLALLEAQTKGAVPCFNKQLALTMFVYNTINIDDAK